MLLAIDIGNSNTVIGIFRGDELVDHLRIESRRNSTEDEYGALLATLLDGRGISRDGVNSAVIGSVVPPLTEVFASLCRRWLSTDALIIGPGVRTGMPILYDNPREVGADRIVNAVAAYEHVKGKSGVIVCDFGTAPPFDVVSARGEYMGGAIAPGVNISLDALFHQASKLPRIELALPPEVIGRNTVGVKLAELDAKPIVLATGGLAELIAAESATIDEVVPMLTLTGLRILFERNK